MISFGSQGRRPPWPAAAPVVALESTIVSHGLPRPDNLRVAREIEQTVEAAGAVPATIGMIGGRIVVGLDDAADRTPRRPADDVVKLSVRDLAPAAVNKADGATTVAATAIAGRARRHRGLRHRRPRRRAPRRAPSTSRPTSPRWPARRSRWSAPASSRSSTWARRWSGWRRSASPWSDTGPTGSPASTCATAASTWTGRSTAPAQVAAMHGRPAVGTRPCWSRTRCPSDEQLDPALHDRVLAEGMAGLTRGGVTGKAVTPYLLAHFHAATGGASLTANIRIILRNAELGARIAAAARRHAMTRRRRRRHASPTRGRRPRRRSWPPVGHRRRHHGSPAAASAANTAAWLALARRR